MRFSAIKNSLLDLLFPRLCLRCKQEGSFFCKMCESTLTFIPPPCIVCGKLVPASRDGRVVPGRTCEYCAQKSFIYAFLSPFSYDEQTVRELIHALKYYRVTALAEVLAGLLCKYLLLHQINIPGEAVIIPIPLYPSRRRTRGFNQAELIAEKLIMCFREGSRPPCDLQALKRVKNTSSQVELSGEKRKSNVSEAFAVTNKDLIKDKTIILVDDVKTTGATLEEAARVLKEAGAKRIWAITLAH